MSPAADIVGLPSEGAMEIVLDHPHLVDSLRFRIEATRSTKQAEVRITVAVVALVSAAERDPKALDSRVLAALKELIAVPWSFSHVVREADAAGFERIKLRAAARVSPSGKLELGRARAQGEPRRPIDCGGRR